MRATRFVLVGFVAAAVVVAFGACTIVDGLTVPQVDDAAEAGDAGDANLGIDVGPCRRPGWPDPPAVQAGGDIQFRVAVTRMDFGNVVTDGGDDAGGSAVGYNLDNECTCFKSDPSAAPDPSSCVLPGTANLACDFPNGVDNATGVLINGPAKTAKLDIAGDVTKAIAGGHNGALIQISQYNGMPDDLDITLSFYESSGPVKMLADGGYDIGNVKPTFTKADIWAVATESLLPNTTPSNYVSIASTPGYVTGGILVASNLNTVLRIDQNLSMALRGSAITARIVKDENGDFSLKDGYVVGRWPTADALRSMGSAIPPGQDSGYLCDDPILFSYLKSVICNAADISTNGPDNKGLKCDALSLGVHFEAASATFGPVLPIQTLSAPCTDPDGGGVSTTCP